ncbi:DUF1641 domain-containing protein [Bacillus xiapuensis]|uniref:DUF1641 domain-containing protein n=1 Tax=Bacillus xiapuensis TaxID=2014075 RepID=UPI000C23D073|nr:DUF1641 domain-containing protein [Bacillus xiapuensis]
MAAPITAIHKHKLTDDEIKEQKLEDLKTLLSENEDALNQIFSIVGELNSIGALEAATKLLQAKEDVANIVLHQISREPVTNLINHLMGVAGVLTAMDPEMTKKLVNSLNSGMEEANQQVNNNEKISMFDLMKILKDPDVNRAVKFGVHFMKGLGKGLKE